MQPIIDNETRRKLERTDRIVHVTSTLSIIMIVVMFTLILIQNQINSDKSIQNASRNLKISREQALTNHKRTQKYIKCVAEALTIPLSERNLQALDACTDNADNQTRADN